MQNAPLPIASSTVKAGKQTFFLDLERAKSGNLFLRVTESRIIGDTPGNPNTSDSTAPADKRMERERKTMLVFEDHLDEFAKAIAAMSIKVQAMRLAKSKK